MRRPSDRTLIRRSLKGGREAFVELIRRHEQPLAALIRRHVGDLHEAEDVLQETLLQAWVGLRRLRDRTKFRAWLLSVARNRCRDFHKSPQRRHKTTDAETMTVYLARLGRVAAKTREEREEVLGALEEVPPAERKVAELFYRKGLTIAEIAERTRSPEGTVKRRLYHAREHLRDALGVRSRRKEN